MNLLLMEGILSFMKGPIWKGILRQGTNKKSEKLFPLEKMAQKMIVYTHILKDWLCLDVPYSSTVLTFNILRKKGLSKYCRPRLDLDAVSRICIVLQHIYNMY